MKHLAYSHSATRALAEIMVCWIHQMLPRPLRSPKLRRGRGLTLRRWLIVIGWIIAIVIQAGLLWLVAEMVQLVHELMTIWLDLAAQHLDLLDLYVTATSPK